MTFLTDAQAALLVEGWRLALRDEALPVKAETLADAYALECDGWVSCDGERWMLTPKATALLCASDLLDARQHYARRN